MSTELVIIEQNAVVLAFSKEGGTDELFERIESQVKSIVPDVSTKKGRDAIGSNAEKVSKSKVLVENYAKELVAEQKAKTKLVDDDRILFCKKMDALRKEILAPRDAYVQAEEDRLQKHRDNILAITAYSQIQHPTALELMSAAKSVVNIVIDESWQEFANEAAIAKEKCLADIANQLEVVNKLEAEQEELVRLRQEAIEREQQERERKIAEDAASAARLEAEQKANAERQADAKREADAIAAAEYAKREAEQAKLNAEREQARLIAENEAAELRQKEALRQAESDRVAALAKAEQDQKDAIEAERKQVEAKRLEAEKAEQKRLADVEHVRGINQSLMGALMSLSLSEGQAKAVITKIAKNEIKHISIQY